jgi:pyridoxal biosynthesis lyase PdxS
MIQYRSAVPRMQDMDYMELMYAALGASVMASVVYGCMAATGQEDLSTLDVDMVTLSAVATFVSTMVARHPEWIV